MQATLPAPRRDLLIQHGDLLIQRATAAIGSGAALLAPPRDPEPAARSAAPAPVGPDLAPDLPAPWRLVPGSRISTVAQRFAGYVRDSGRQAHLHSMIGLGAEVTRQRIAGLNLGPHRVTVYADAAGAGFEARWTTGETLHRLTAGSTTLGEFLVLLQRMDWR